MHWGLLVQAAIREQTSSRAGRWSSLMELSGGSRTQARVAGAIDVWHEGRS